MKAKFNVFYIFCLCLIEFSFGCRRVPKEHEKRIEGDNGYRIIIGDNPNGYQPGKIYNIFLVGSRTHNNLQQFTHFTFNALSSSAPNRESAILTITNPKRTGRFQLFSDALTIFDDNCVNTVIEANDFSKTEVQVMWVAPPTGSGCVALTAMVYESSKSWYSDDGNLTKIICEGKSQKDLTECCACDEAKYSFVFEGIWSNETHPRDYPFAIWLTHFSDVIGATHETNFSFWGENHIATDGFRSLAEFGSVRALETELRAKGPRLRTLIKAAGLWYPDVNTNTSSQFRTDRIHHKLSLVSMFGPSPDWVVGISGLNLCKADCSWEDSFDIDLYPWDAGTDNGITYMSPNSETQPRERMYRITTMYPEDPRQPFYNPKSSTMTPLAKLYIRKVKSIPQNCNDDFLQSQVLDISENTEEDVRSECNVSDFTDWAPCSVTCGKGIRMRTREYINPARSKQFQCNRQLISREMCVADKPECEEQDDDDQEENLAQSVANIDDGGEGIGICKTTSWSEWSPCSVTCGIGISMRTRTFINWTGRKKCPHISVVEKEKCMKPECVLQDIVMPDPMCPVTLWSDWSPCSTTCGKGVRIRTRQHLGEPSKEKECSERIILNEQEACAQRVDCIFNPEEAMEICSMNIEVGPCRGVYNRFAYNTSLSRCASFTYGGCRGNQNNFLTVNECMQTCQNLATSTQPPTRLSRPTTSTVRQPLNTEIISQTASTTTTTPINEEGLPIDCVLSDWTNWSSCSVSCGTGGFSEKYRRVLVQARNGGIACARKLTKRKRCNFNVPCFN